MSKKTKKRKTRLKGTDTKKPCVDCGRSRDRFKFFKPRWAGCVAHRTPNGRRYYQDGCEDCDKLVNGNIRQPRCVDCDKKRPKKSRKKSEASKTETPKVEETPAPEPTPAPTPEPTPEPEPVVETPTEPEPEPVVEEPQGETTVEAQEEASADSVTVPEPAPAPEPKAPAKTGARPAIASMDDLSKLFGGADG